ncbi:MAG: hypothetical protein ACLFWM_09460 [Actinomycetota bacterium]
MAAAGSAPSAAAELECRLDRFHVTTSAEFGPRILGFWKEGSPPLFARLGPEAVIDTGAGPVHLRGGHRLWASPEIPSLTHLPDDRPVQATCEEGVLRVAAPADGAGFAKELRVRAEDGGLTVEHRLRWTGPEPVRAGAWAITQLPLGGAAFLPLPTGGSGYQADRSLVLWPYTDLTDPRIAFRREGVVVHARAGAPLKLGVGPSPGRIGYLREGWLFIKTAEAAAEEEMPDRGAVGQVYCGEDFCELETLGPLATLLPGSETGHRERWWVERCEDEEAALCLLGAGG